MKNTANHCYKIQKNPILKVLKKSVFSAILALFLLVFSIDSLLAQYQIKGIVRDASNGDPVPFASVGILGLNAGTSTNFLG
jgi:hypothetical protein